MAHQWKHRVVPCFWRVLVLVRAHFRRCGVGSRLRGIGSAVGGAQRSRSTPGLSSGGGMSRFEADGGAGQAGVGWRRLAKWIGGTQRHQVHTCCTPDAIHDVNLQVKVSSSSTTFTCIQPPPPTTVVLLQTYTEISHHRGRRCLT